MLILSCRQCATDVDIVDKQKQYTIGNIQTLSTLYDQETLHKSLKSRSGRVKSPHLCMMETFFFHYSIVTIFCCTFRNNLAENNDEKITVHIPQHIFEIFMYQSMLYLPIYKLKYFHQQLTICLVITRIAFSVSYDSTKHFNGYRGNPNLS